MIGAFVQKNDSFLVPHEEVPGSIPRRGKQLVFFKVILIDYYNIRRYRYVDKYMEQLNKKLPCERGDVKQTCFAQTGCLLQCCFLLLSYGQTLRLIPLTAFTVAHCVWYRHHPVLCTHKKNYPIITLSTKSDHWRWLNSVTHKYALILKYSNM